MTEVGLDFNISSLGTYNADAIKRLLNPTLIYAKYVDRNNKSIPIVLIYVIDKSINGIIFKTRNMLFVMCA